MENCFIWHDNWNLKTALFDTITEILKMKSEI